MDQEHENYAELDYVHRPGRWSRVLTIALVCAWVLLACLLIPPVLFVMRIVADNT
ncbi:MAG: hypothetical protein J2P46_02040 [Zavarzinella sp.]|nr:hypothetical protein [Zavarzinella sp.]